MRTFLDQSISSIFGDDKDDKRRLFTFIVHNKTLKTNNCKVGLININDIAGNFVVYYFRIENLRTKQIYNTFLLFTLLRAENKHQQFRNKLLYQKSLKLHWL